MATLTSPGIGSGLDISSMISQLVAAERAPVETRLNRREASYQAELSAYGALKSALSSFQSSLSTLTDFSNFLSLKARSSDSSIISATASDSAITGSYSLEVTDLAKAQTLASKAFDETTSTVGTGTLTFQFGTYNSGSNTFTPSADKATQTVVIDPADDSLLGIRDAVNNADVGVSASIVNDGSGYRLVFNSDDTGADNSLKITVADTTDGDGSDIDDAGLSQLAYDPTEGYDTGKNMTETVIAQDASFTVNGLSITSASNEVSGVIEGVTLSLKDTTSGSPVKVTVSQNTSAVAGNVESFVTGYNELIKTLNSLTSYNAETGRAAVLQGDSITRNVTSQIRNILSSAVEGLGGAYRSLADIGITTQAGGTLALDSSKLSDAIGEDPSIVGRLFSAAGTADDSLINFLESSSDSVIGDYDINITQIATQGQYTGAATTTLTVDDGNDTFAIKVDGTQSGTISLTQKIYASGDELAAEVQSRINGDSALQDAGITVSVSYVSGKLEITSDRYGSASTVEVTSVDTDTTLELGLSVTTGTDGLDVAGTINGVAATGSGQILTGAGDAAGIKLEVLGGLTGSRGSVVFSRGIADILDSLMERYLDSDSLIDARTEGLNSRIDDINEQRERLAIRLEMLEKRYLTQFTALDTLIGQMQSTSSYLAQQLASLPYANMNKS